MAATFVQSTQLNTSGTSGSVAFVSGQTAGNLNIVAVRSPYQVTSVTDSVGNTYSLAIEHYNADHWLTIYFAENIGSGANTVTINLAASSSLRAAIHEYSGLATSSALDQVAGNHATSSSPDSSSVTTTQAGELIFGTASVSGSGSFTAGASFTRREEVVSKIASEDRTVSSTGSYSASFSLSSSDLWGCCVATFKESGGASAASLLFKPTPMAALLVR